MFTQLMRRMPQIQDAATAASAYREFHLVGKLHCGKNKEFHSNKHLQAKEYSRKDAFLQRIPIRIKHLLAAGSKYICQEILPNNMRFLLL